MAAYGEEVLNGIQLAIDRYNRDAGTATVQLVLQDTADGTRPIEKQLSALLRDSHPLAVIGPLVSQQVEAAAKVADDDKIPLITPSATLSNVRQLSPYVFSTALTYSIQAEQMADYAMRRYGCRRFAVIHPDNGYGRQLAHYFIEEAKRQGGEVITVESYREDETDFAKEIARVKAASWRRIQQDRQSNLGSQPGNRENGKGQRAVSRRGLDAIYLPGTFRHAVLIAAQLRFHDLKVRLLGSNAWHTSDIAHFPDRSIRGGVFVDSFYAQSRVPAVREFVEAYRARYNSEPSLFAAQAYEAAQLVVSGIAAGATSGKKLRVFLERADSLPALLGPASFNSTGVLNRRLFVLQMSQDGQVIPLP